MYLISYDLPFEFVRYNLVKIADMIKHIFSNSLMWGSTSIANYFLYVLALAILVLVIKLTKSLFDINI